MNPEYLKKFIVITGLVIMFVLGIICAFWPEKVQTYSIKQNQKGFNKFLPFNNSIKNYMASTNYLYNIRFSGILILGFFTFALIVLLIKNVFY